MLQLGWRFPAAFNARLAEVGIWQSGWLATESARLGIAPLALLGDQLRRAALAFHYYPDRTFWYGLPGPLLDPLSGALLALALGGATMAVLAVLYRRSLGRPGGLLSLAVWWWLAIVLGGALTLPTPASQRLVTLSVPAALLVATGADWLLGAVGGRRGVGVYGCGLLLFGGASLWLYFGVATPARVYGNPQAEIATAAVPLLADLPPEMPLLFFGPPRMTWSFSTFAYLTPHLAGVDVGDPWTVPPHPALVAPERGMVFLFLPERGAELQLVLESFPTGEYRPVESPVHGTIAGIYIVYPRAVTP
jgi:hypothetical protein